jgi:hypothetical protein
MANFVITGKAEQTDESSYTIQSTGEVVTVERQLDLPVAAITSSAATDCLFCWS